MPQVTIRLTQEDHDLLEKYLERTGRKQAEVIREALLKVIDPSCSDSSSNKEVLDAVESLENRMAVLLIRMGIDLNSIYALAWALTDEQPDREELFQKCYETGVTRFRRKLKGLEKDMVNSLVGAKKTQESPHDDE